MDAIRRTASESAIEIKQLDGVRQLTKVFTEAKRLKRRAINCFTVKLFTTDEFKWSFDNVKDKKVSW